MADDDIVLGADASQAIGEMRKLQSAVIESMKAAGASSKELSTVNKGLERSFASVAASAVKTGQATVAASRSEVSATKTAIKAAEDLARARERATAKTGLAQNSKGQTYDKSTGQFATAGAAQAYAQEIKLQQKLIDNEAALETMRSKNAARAQAQSSAGVQAARAETEAYKARQAVLEKAFKSGITGLANPDATKLQRFGNVLSQIPPATWNQKIGKATDAIMGMSNSTRYALYEVANSATVAGAAFIAFGALSIRAAVAHERAFANVQRTTQTSAEGYAALQRQLEVMSMELPITYEELTNIAMAAGQLGIGAAGVAQFTKVVGQLTATTNLTADAAGVALARFRTFFSEADSPELAVSEATFTNLASSILKVGVNSIATESGIVNVAVQIASMGDYAGLTANQVIGLAGALSSIGVAPELSRGTITRTFSNIGNAVSKGGVQLEKFAELAGVSSAQFSAAWGTEDFAGIFQRMMKGINDFGGDANLMLMELGFNSVRDRPLLLRLASAADEAGVSGGLLAQTLGDAYSGWTANSELALQYSKISTTTSARIQVLGQSFEQLAASMGEQSGGFLGEMAVQLTAVIRGFEEFSQTDVGQTLGSIAVQGSLVIGALLLIVGGAARSAASIQAIGTAWTEMSKKGATAAGTLGIAFRGLSAALGVIGVVGAIAGIVGGFIAMNDAAQKAKMGVQDVGGLVAAMKEDAEAGASGVEFFAEANKGAAAEQKRSAEQAAGMSQALRGVGDDATAGASGMDTLAASTSKAAFVFGDAAEAFYKSQLLQSENFQDLFDPDKQWASTDLENMFGRGFNLKQLGITPDMLDWDGLIKESIEGTVDADKIYADLIEKTGIKERDGFGRFTTEADNIRNYANSVAASYGSLPPEIQKVINSQAALTGESKTTFNEIIDGSGEAAGALGGLDDVTQKLVENMAAGFTKFVDIGSLIDLTQKMGEVFSQEDTSAEDMAAQWEKEWSDAYGGAAFSLEEYLSVFRRAGDEQGAFVENLQVLRQRLGSLGLSDAVLDDLSQMGPEANRLVQSLVTGTDEQLVEFENLWGQTGYDSMVAFATQAAIGQEIVNNILRAGGLEGLRQFNDALASGSGVDEALAQLQLDVNGNPIIPNVITPAPPNFTASQKALWAAQNALNTFATISIPNVDSSGVKIGTKTLYPYYSGGYTGPGGKYDPAGVVHAGEFVMTAAATRAIGVNNLYAMMNAAQSGRSAPRGRGYAQGGAVNSSGPTFVELSPTDRALLRQLGNLTVRIGDRDIARAVGSANFDTKRQGY